ncbi:hypothetical protein [Micromonospora sp. NPDC005806]|uniref:hypothetical protein n=1 Tax=Micromonospora sp. NPDC005806 TaxID=3364234 RepID=UPI00368EE2EB
MALALAMFGAGAAKLAGEPAMVRMFDDIGALIRQAVRRIRPRPRRRFHEVAPPVRHVKAASKIGRPA